MAKLPKLNKNGYSLAEIVSKKQLRKVGDITQDLEPLLFELLGDHDMQVHEVLGMVIAWARVHMPGSIEVYEEDNTSPELIGIKYGPKNGGIK